MKADSVKVKNLEAQKLIAYQRQKHPISLDRNSKTVPDVSQKTALARGRENADSYAKLTARRMAGSSVKPISGDWELSKSEFKRKGEELRQRFEPKLEGVSKKLSLLKKEPAKNSAEIKKLEQEHRGLSDRYRAESQKLEKQEKLANYRYAVSIKAEVGKAVVECEKAISQVNKKNEAGALLSAQLAKRLVDIKTADKKASELLAKAEKEAAPYLSKNKGELSQKKGGISPENRGVADLYVKISRQIATLEKNPKADPKELQTLRSLAERTIKQVADKSEQQAIRAEAKKALLSSSFASLIVD